jgi:hypothetical protein
MKIREECQKIRQLCMKIREECKKIGHLCMKIREECKKQKTENQRETRYNKKKPKQAKNTIFSTKICKRPPSMQ